MYYTGYLLTQASRNKLLETFPPKYARVICEHITENFGVKDDSSAPEQPQSVLVVGYVDSGDGVEALAVTVNGETERPDGRKYHITLSLAEGRRPVESNDYIDKAEQVSPQNVLVIPKLFAC